MHRVAYSPVNAKSMFYQSNGTGRDSYIIHDNGGAYAPHFKMQRENRQTTVTVGNKPQRPFSAGGDPKSLRYHSNGTGRDSYVTIGDGGLHVVNLPGEHNRSFVNELRTYGKRPGTANNDFYSWSQFSWKPTGHTVAERKNAKILSNSIKRLAQPKRQRQKVAVPRMMNQTIC